jgi:hypothetical protein
VVEVVANDLGLFALGVATGWTTAKLLVKAELRALRDGCTQADDEGES